MIKPSRNSNIELLRIFAMLFIIAGHFAGQGELFQLDDLSVFDSILLGILGSGQRVSINVFLIISVWYLVDQDFNPAKIIRTWGEVFIYTVTITLALKLTGNPVTLKQLFQSFMPYLGRPLWFASAYISLLMISPFLKKAQNLDKAQYRALVIVSGIIVCILPMFAAEMDTYLCAIVWFCFIYILVGYYKLHIGICKGRGIFHLILGILLYAFLAGFSALPIQSDILSSAQTLAYRFLHDFKSLPNLLISALIVSGALRFKPSYNKCINILASGSFAVYIIHQTPVLFPLLWKWILGCQMFSYNYLVLSFVQWIITIYLACSTVDIARRKLLEPFFMKSKLTNNLIKKLNIFYSHI